MTTPTSLTGRQGTHGKLWLLALTALVVALAVGGYLVLAPVPVGEPPQVDLSDVDPAVRQAIEEALAGVRAAPRAADAWGKLGVILTGAVFEEAALACFVQAEKLDGENPRWPYYQACVALAHDRADALPKLRRAVELCDDDLLGPRLRLAETYFRLGQYDDAYVQFEEVLRRDPNHGRANLGLARCHLQASRLNDARRHLDRAGTHRLTRKAALALAAEWHERQDDHAAAQRALAALVELPDDPEWPDELRNEVTRQKVGEPARLAMAATLLDQNRGDAAVNLLHELVRDYPESARAWCLLGWTLAQRRQFADAEAALQTALKLNPADSQARFEIGALRYQRGDRRGAIVMFREAAALKPSYLKAHFNLGVCLQEEGDCPAAIAAFRAAVLCQPLSVQAHVRLGALLIQEDLSAARVHLEQAVTLNPKDAEARRLLESLKK